MLKKYLAIGLMGFCTIGFADSMVGNIFPSAYESVNVAVSNQKYISYMAFNYQMSDTKFKSFLNHNSLPNSANLSKTKNIVYISKINNNEFYRLQDELTTEFHNKNLINATCAIKQGFCGSGTTQDLTSESNTVKSIFIRTSVSFRIFTSKTDTFIRVTSNDVIRNSPTSLEKFSSQAEASILYGRNKRYIIISQTKDNGILYGHIAFVSFNK